MKRLSVKKFIAFGLAVTMAITLLPPTLTVKAKTNVTREEYDRQIATYNIGDAVKGYKEYLSGYAKAARPETTVKAGAADLVRYEEGQNKVTPVEYKDFEGYPLELHGRKLQPLGAHGRNGYTRSVPGDTQAGSSGRS